MNKNVFNKLLLPSGSSGKNKSFFTAGQCAIGQGGIFWRVGHLKFISASTNQQCAESPEIQLEKYRAENTEGSRIQRKVSGRGKPRTLKTPSSEAQRALIGQIYDRHLLVEADNGE